MTRLSGWAKFFFFFFFLEDEERLGFQLQIESSRKVSTYNNKKRQDKNTKQMLRLTNLGTALARTCAQSLNTIRTYVYRPTRTTGRGRKDHQSKRAQQGLFHGKDVQFGRSISHSGVRSLRRWSPNVISKRVWSDTLDDWVRFKMTTRALKEIDNSGGIDNYLLLLDNESAAKSNYVTKMRGIIASTLFHRGSLQEKFVRKLGYHKQPPPPPGEAVSSVGATASGAAKEMAHLP